MPVLHYLDQCASTNDEIMRLILPGRLEMNAIYTFNQTQGRGQYGKTWDSGTNLNIAFTVAVPVIYSGVPAELFNFRTAQLIADFLANLTSCEVLVKWPNDLIIHNKKVAGLLTEKRNFHKEQYYILGAGINVLQQSFTDLPQAGSLLTQTGKTFDLHKTAEELHQYLNANIPVSVSEDILMEEINRRLFRKNTVSVFNIGEKRQNGIIRKTDAEGMLWVELEEDGLQKFFHKEIEMLY